MTILFLIFFACTLAYDDDILGLTSPSFLNEEETALTPTIAQLDSPNWVTALEDLEKIAETQHPSVESSIANSALGDFYAGLTPVSGSWTPPPVDLKKAFRFYVRSVVFPFAKISKSYYMISFIAYHHPTMVTEEFLPKFKAIVGDTAEQSSPEDPEALPAVMDPISADPSLSRNSDSEPSIFPNIPLSFLHQSYAAQGNYTPALISLGYKMLHGYHTPLSCLNGMEYYQHAAYQVVSSIRQTGPQIKLSTESVRLDEEFASGRSTISEEEDVVQFYRYSADIGNVDSQIAMGIIHLEGEIGGLPRDYARAFHYFRLGADAGDATAISNLAYMYQMGFGTELDNATAVSLYLKAAQMGSATAQTQLGVLYYYGWGGVKKDISEAKRWFEIAAEKSDPEAFLYLGRMAFAGIGVPKNYGRARSLFQQSAQGGNLPSMYNLGIINANGLGVPPSCHNAAALYGKILERSYLKNATTTAYKLFARGLYDRALVRYELAADLGDPLAQVNAAWLYEVGLGVDRLGGAGESGTAESGTAESGAAESGAAESGATESGTAESGTAESGTTESGTTESGTAESGVRKEDLLKKAFEFYLKAADQNSPHALLKVGDYYYYGWGMAKPNPTLAATYYGAASNLRNAQATFNLGYMHHMGIGLPKDPHLAKRFYDLATEISTEASLPSTLALMALAAEQFLESVQAGGLIYGYQWDTLVIAVLSAALVLALIFRQIMLWV